MHSQDTHRSTSTKCKYVQEGAPGSTAHTEDTQEHTTAMLVRMLGTPKRLAPHNQQATNPERGKVRDKEFTIKSTTTTGATKPQHASSNNRTADGTTAAAKQWQLQ
eukprot:NODE_3743_length_526_cov_124.488470_g3182_i0.p2 GENE.NODE_3743_length_526_cov_124.488470_g3182_i0~~NODE_3743_length_526_cov_124.488470_g3182_i0.p2  ORF type:complete len:106 (-),score=17.93 NODE_3743_length_526_cov_124.488470_g3182_i0:121-438(-)